MAGAAQTHYSRHMQRLHSPQAAVCFRASSFSEEQLHVSAAAQSFTEQVIILIKQIPVTATCGS